MLHYIILYIEYMNFYFVFVVSRLHRLWYGKKQEEQLQSDLPEDIRMTCTQFTKYHKDQCLHDIVKMRRWEHVVLLTAPLVDKIMS